MLQSRRHLISTVAVGVVVTALIVPSAHADNRYASNAQQLRDNAAAVVNASPSDAELAGKKGVDLIAEAVRCANLDERTYCLHLGWRDRPPTRAELSDMVGSEMRYAEVGQGDLTLSDQVRAWARLPQSQRFEQDRIEMNEAVAAVGKVKLYDLRLTGQSVPEEFWEKYPETASWGQQMTADCISCLATVGSASKGQKQSRSYWCGPTSMVAFGWNDPERGGITQMRSQSHWASRLGTTADGTSISTIASRINSDLTWDNRVGAYVVVSIVGWNYDRWRGLFINHIFGPGAPIQLHPDLNPDNNKYDLNTGGHFNVGRGYDFRTSTEKISIWEPAGGSAVPVSFWDTFSNIRKQNHAHSMDNIAY